MIKKYIGLFLFIILTTSCLAQKKGTLVWADLEMSNIDPNKGVITEIALIITDDNLNVIAEGPNINIHHSDEVLAQASDWVKKNLPGTLEKSRTSKISPEDAENMIREFILRYTNSSTNPEMKSKNPLLSGNSVQSDLRFLIKYMPNVYSVLNYRIIDVSTIKELVKRWYPELRVEIDKKLNSIKKGLHSAYEDIKESIEELRYYKSSFFIKQ